MVLIGPGKSSDGERLAVTRATILAEIVLIKGSSDSLDAGQMSTNVHIAHASAHRRDCCAGQLLPTHAEQGRRGRAPHNPSQVATRKKSSRFGIRHAQDNPMMIALQKRMP
jgi:hypothetical protein